MPAGFDAAFAKAKELVADFRSNEKFHLSPAFDGELRVTLPDALKVPPISQHGNVAEIIGKFGGAPQLRNAVNPLPC
ncbi:MAG: hypothetical protein WBW41_16125 [Verrucomicrobiia bacterium]